MSVAADKGYDTRLRRRVRALGVTPHVAAKRRCSAIDGRTSATQATPRASGGAKLIEEATAG